MSFKLDAKKRDNKGEKDRKEGWLPAVLYGAGEDAINLNLVYNDYEKLMIDAGHSNLIDLFVDGVDSGKILVQDTQFDPITDRLLHIDLKRIEMGKEIEAVIALNFVNESSVIREQGGTLVKNTEEVLIRCLPKDLVANIEVDLSVIKTFDDVIKIKDLQLAEGLFVVSPSEEEMVAKAIPALTEEQIKAMEEKIADVEKVEVAGESEKEGEEATAGDETGKEEKKEEKPSDEKKK